MRRRQFLRQLLVIGCGGASLSISGCGTILHSERIHRPHSRDIDWQMAALNGLGLALFFVPGVLAFVVDFHTGAIYLPPAGNSGHPVAEAGGSLDGWERKPIPTAELQPERIESVVSERLGSRLSLHESGARVSKMANPTQLHQQLQLHQQDSQYGVTPESFFGEMLVS